MRIVTINLNGIRSAAKKGFFTWVNHTQPDIICCQEIKAHGEHLENELIIPKGYYSYFLPALKKGYSGVGLYCKQKPLTIQTNHLYAEEGRYIEAHFHNLIVASVYLPSGTTGAERQKIKYQVLDSFFTMLKDFSTAQKNYIICGDFNIAHQTIDLKNWRANQKNSGFLPEERAWLDKVFNELGFIDVYRQTNPTTEQYTWWSNFGNAYNNNVGWRIDYQIASPSLVPHILNSSVYMAERFSDHAPLITDYSLELKT